MWGVYSVNCPTCGEEHAFRGETELPVDAVCHRCNSKFIPNGKVEYEELCVYCGHQNFFPQNIDEPKCEKCGFKMPSSGTESDDTNPVEITKVVAAGIKTGDSGTIIVVLVIIIAIFLMVLAKS